MTNKEILNQIEEYLQPIVVEVGVEVCDIELVKEGPNLYLRIYIEKEDGVTISDCESVSRKIEVILDEKDPIATPYILEVSSPGIDRPLKKDSDYEKYSGEIVDIKLYKAINKQKEFQGELVGLENDVVTIIVDDETIKFDKADIAICRLAVIF